MAAPLAANLCKLKVGKAVGAHKNFAKTFNWLVDSMKNLQGGIACNVNWVAENMPVIDVNTYVTGDRTEDSETVTPDSMVATLSDLGYEDMTALSSLERVTLNPEADLSAQVNLLQLFNFDLSDSITVNLSDENNPPTPEGEEEQLSSGYDFIVRKDGRVQYAKLSAHFEGGRGGLPGPFEMTLSGTTATFANCVMRVARAYFFYPDMTCQVLSSGDQMVYSVLQHSETPSVTVSAGPYSDIAGKLGTDWSNLLSTTVTPLYRVTDGEVKCDYRYMMNVQAYDSRNYSGWVG